MLLMLNFAIKLGRCHYPIVRKIFWPIRRQLFFSMGGACLNPEKLTNLSTCLLVLLFVFYLSWISSQYYSSKFIILLKMADDREWRHRDSTVFFLFPDDARYVGIFYHEEFDYISGFGLFQLTWVPRRLKIATNTWDIQWLPLFGMVWSSVHFSPCEQSLFYLHLLWFLLHEKRVQSLFSVQSICTVRKGSARRVCTFKLPILFPLRW